MDIEEIDDASEDEATVVSTRMRNLTTRDDDDDGRKMPAVPPRLLVAPRVRQLVTTQRAATYANSPNNRPNKATPTQEED